MEYGAIDLHKKESQIRIVTERGEVLNRRIATTRDCFTAVFEGRRPTSRAKSENFPGNGAPPGFIPAELRRYFGVNLEIVWAAVQKELPELGVAVEALLKDS